MKMKMKGNKCLRCGISLEKYKPTKRGWRYNKKGRVQKWVSRCGYTFTKAGVAFRMRAPRWKILEAIKLRDKGLTLSQIATQLGDVSRQTILSWIQGRRRSKNKVVVVEREIRGHLREGKPVKTHTARFKVKI